MSSIPTKQIDGDVAVGRNVSAGGDANIQGDARVGHNLVVKGWLDAKNIKGPNKGIFLDVIRLREEYPRPHNGWWALVGHTLPAPLYIADGGKWLETGQSAGNPTVEFEQYNEIVKKMDHRLHLVEGDVSDHKIRISEIIESINRINTTLSEKASISQLRGRSDDSSAYTDPFVFLGEYSEDLHGEDYLRKFNDALDSLCGQAEDVSWSRRWTGNIRATVDGRNIEIHQYVVNFSSRVFTQTIEGNVTVGDNGIVLPSNTYASLIRSCNGGEWTPWQEEALLTAADKAALDATRRTVDIGALDALLEGRNIIEILPLLGEWTVTDEYSGIPLPTGRLTMYADGMMHQVTQELHGNYLPDLTGHQDGRVNVLRRSYGIRAGGDGGVPPGEFSPWAYAAAQPQASSEGSEADYIYSVSDTNDARCVMTVRNSEIFQHEGRLVFRRGFWSSAEEGGKYITRDVPEATESAAGAMSAADKRLMASIVHLGEFASKDAACDWAARSEVAGNKRAALLLFTAPGTAGQQLEGRIIQQVNGNRESMQFLLWDKRLYRRNVTGASGTAGDATNAFPWEETGAQKLEYAPAVRTLRMKSYENGVVASVVLPEASTTAAGLMPKADKTFLESLQNTVVAQINQKISELERRIDALEGQ